MKTETPPYAAAEYFKAKLAFEATPHQVKANTDSKSIVLIDVRDPESFKAEHIPGAVNCPLEDLAKHLAKLPKDKTLVTYCWNLTCAMAPKAALMLAEKGFKVQELVGGIEEYRKKFPTEGPQAK